MPPRRAVAVAALQLALVAALLAPNSAALGSFGTTANGESAASTQHCADGACALAWARLTLTAALTARRARVLGRSLDGGTRRCDCEPQAVAYGMLSCFRPPARCGASFLAAGSSRAPSHTQMQCWRDPPCIRWNYLDREKCRRCVDHRRCPLLTSPSLTSLRSMKADTDYPTRDPHLTVSPEMKAREM